MSEKPLTGIKNRILQKLAMLAPGGFRFRVSLHRLRGVQIGREVWIGPEVIIETAYPSMVKIGDNVVVGMRTTILGHFREVRGVTIENGVYIGPCSVILPGVKVGRGSVIFAGSVVTNSVPPMSAVQGNPAKILAKCGVPLSMDISKKEFVRNLRKVE